MSAAARRETLRDRSFRILLVVAVIGLSLQFVGSRPVAEVVFSVAFLAACTVMATLACYRRAQARVATKVNRLAHDQLRTELATFLADRKK